MILALLSPARPPWSWWPWPTWGWAARSAASAASSASTSAMSGGTAREVIGWHLLVWRRLFLILSKIIHIILSQHIAVSDQICQPVQLQMGARFGFKVFSNMLFIQFCPSIPLFCVAQWPIWGIQGKVKIIHQFFRLFMFWTCETYEW